MMVPYAARGALTAYKVARGYRRYRMAGAVARHVVRNSGRYYKAARTIGRAYRRYRSNRTVKRARVEIGHNGKTSAKKNYQVSVDLIARNSNTQFFNDLTIIPGGSGNNQRLRPMIRLSGFKICMEVVNILSLDLYFNWAIISPKAGNTGSTPNFNTFFFRSQDETRGEDFNSTGLSSLLRHCLPINTDRWNVLAHRRYQLAPRMASQTNVPFSNKSTRLKIERYVKLNKMIRYESADNASCEDKIWFIYWFGQFGEVSGVAPSSVANHSVYIHTYFREPRSG